MENLYRTLEKKKEQLSRFDTKVDGDYYLYFVEGFVPEMINSAIQDLRTKDADKIDSLSNILIKYKVYFMSRYSETMPKYRIDSRENDAYIHLPKSDAEELMNKIIAFFMENGMLSSFHAKYAPGIIEIETSLDKLITAYGIELSKESKTKESFEETKRFTTKANAKITYLDSVLVDDVHFKTFEDKFLDKCITTIIKNEISNLDKKNFKDEDTQKVLIQGKLIIQEEGKDGGYIIINSNEVDNTLKLIRDFMSNYGLGNVEYTQHTGIVVHFNTTLADLMDAYYMEKQRIEHYTSGDYLVEEAEPTAKKLK